ncbi:MAG: glycosyltransferase family 4 protein [Eubacteriales bacterium]
MKKHILVISQYFYPEQFRINDICSEWVKRGYRVTVITGIPNYPQGKYYKGYGLFSKRKESYNGIEIVRLPIIPRGKTSVMMVMNYLSFVISGFFWKLFTRLKADHVFIFEVSPMTQALPGVWYAKRLKVPCFLYVQDLWPENIEIVTGIKNKYILGSVGKMVDYIYARCSRIFTTSNSFVTAIEKRGVLKEKIKFWPQYAEDFYMLVGKTNVEEIPNDGVFNIIFTGNIGTAQGLDILPKTALLLKERNKKVRFNIVGDGRFKDTFTKLVKESGVEDIFNFIDKQPATRIPELLAASDAALITLTDSPLFSMTIPAKLQSYLACGIPIIASANGETKEIIRNANAGVYSPAGDADELAERILYITSKTSEEMHQLALNAQNYYKLHFGKKNLLNIMDEYFNENEYTEGNNHV